VKRREEAEDALVAGWKGEREGGGVEAVDESLEEGLEEGGGGVEAYNETLTMSRGSSYLSRAGERVMLVLVLVLRLMCR